MLARGLQTRVLRLGASARACGGAGGHGRSPQLSLRERSCCWRPLSPEGQLCRRPNRQLASNPTDAAKWYRAEEEPGQGTRPTHPRGRQSPALHVSQPW